MSNSHRWQSNTALFTALALTAGAAAPLVVQAPAHAQTTFYDVQSNYWAQPFIQELAQRGVIRGFPDGSFRPEAPVTRAQFAAMVRQAFNRSTVRQPINFVDVPSNYWALDAIREAYSTGFLTGYPGNVFNPEQNIPRAQVLVSLSSGLGYSTAGSGNSLQVYTDAGAIPDYARTAIAAATERQIVVNYPNVQVLNPNQTATRAEVAAFIYQALVQEGQATAIASPYVVGQAQPQPQPTATVPSGTAIPVRYEAAERILLAPEEPEPVPVTLTVARNVTAQNGAVVIPAGSQVVGELRTVQGGAQFYASQIVLTNGTRINANATSQVVTNTETVRRGGNVRGIIRGAALGAAAAAGVSAVTGDRDVAVGEVLGGAGAGALLNVFLGRDRIQLIAVDPETDLNLTLNSSLTFQ
ncbi:S-layer homology domain-containing protein [Oculatella sp. LEGE 06141]|uniref:S-layer homology domain-containing protein n=1 Tax=Oculatella sp. LEGE 06141 TaxID=1828648 RepID=UPI00188282BB|nr:S-layer homology domain-containing protein [Oculatella sp. LEGE 06141]MBE9180484.1 S-layer homology domain-containing protein [Oculatella sp. LEGE 06141]